MTNRLTHKYFLFLFCSIPVTYLFGSAVSLANIILINLSFIILIIYRGDYKFLKSEPIKYLLILYIYLIFNSFLSIDRSINVFRNFGFIRFIILFAAINYFFKYEDFYNKVFKFWLFIILIVSADTCIEQFTGKNIFGFNYGERFDNSKPFFSRVVSFFKDEAVVGGYLLGFYFILSGFLFNKLNNKKIIIPYIILITILAVIILTGERSNSIRAFLGFILFILFLKKINSKKKIILIITIISLITFFISNQTYLKIRFISNIKSIFTTHTIYFDIYKSGIQVFKNHKLFGVGNKNYRVETCRETINSKVKNSENYFCQNHPHQIYIELLSEHGLIGSFLILFVLFKLIFLRTFDTFFNNNYVKIGSLIYMLTMFIPLIPSGAIFGDFLLTLLMINLSIFYALDKNINIFAKN